MLRTTSRVLTATILALVLAIAAYVLLWYMVEERLERAAASHTARAQALARNLEISTLEKTLEETKNDRERLRDFVVTEDTLTEFLALIEGAVRAQGLKASTRSVEIEPGASGSFEMLALTIVAEGDYIAQRKLIALLETMPFQVDVRGVRLDRVAGDTWSGVYTFAVTKERKP